jgi:hypothetical protein
MTTTNTPDTCQNIIRVEEKDKARNESLNRMILQHAEEMVYMHDKVSQAHTVCGAFLIALIVTLLGGGYAFYLVKTSADCAKPVEQVKATRQGGLEYIMKIKP